MKQKLTALLLALATALTVCACSGGASSSAASEKSYKIAIVQLVDNSAFSEMISAFQAKMNELGYTDKNTVFDIKNAQGDMSTLNSICADLKNSDYDLIVPIVTPAAQAVVNAEVSAPVVFISVTSPVGAGIMTSMDQPDKNATGTSNVVPVDEIFSLAKKLTPDASNIGILYCPGEKNAVLTVEKAKAYLDENDYTYTEVTVASSGDVQQAAQSLAGKVDAIYVPIDSTVQSAMEQVTAAAAANHIPVYGSDPVMVKSGALACVSVSNTQLGQQSAEMADKVLQGTAVADIPAVALTDYQYVVNASAAADLEITIPEIDGLVKMGE
ncbi:MAG: ABC transporter substrate-binding protein [Firmicutes bacterium]|nr:ABC transporter substrate-binding protein [Bacillota bacterium]